MLDEITEELKHDNWKYVSHEAATVTYVKYTPRFNIRKVKKTKKTKEENRPKFRYGEGGHPIIDTLDQLIYWNKNPTESLYVIEWAIDSMDSYLKMYGNGVVNSVDIFNIMRVLRGETIKSCMITEKFTKEQAINRMDRNFEYCIDRSDGDVKLWRKFLTIVKRYDNDI
tara:strand:- start:1166 stop:1672 length:507 start_codon:yes stop_codon:yes gene_type:complete